MSLASVRTDSRFQRIERRAVPRAAAANAEVMASDERTDGSIGVPSRGQVEAVLERILDSRTFRQSERHRAFLRYVVQAALDGRSRFLKEVVIGIEVFRRDLDGYDPRRDSIVRVEARRLRKKLARYYLAEGERDAIEIRLEAGSYVPHFAPRTGERRVGAGAPLFLVLPCRAGGDDRAVARGLADQVIDRLGAVGGVKVLAPLAAMRMDDADLDIDALRRDHGVRYIVAGSITRVGERLRCVLHLSCTDDCVQRWSGVFDFDPASTEASADRDLFAFQDRVVEAAYEAVRAERGERG